MPGRHAGEGARRRTEERALRDLDRLAEPTHREVDQAALTLLLSIEEVHEQSCRYAW